MKTAIVGAGELGEWFTRSYHTLGKNVLISDINENKSKSLAEELGISYGTTADIIAEADEILLAPSLEALNAVIEENAKGLAGKIVYDIGSVKKGATELLHDISDKAFSIHPMWGGATPGYNGQNLVMIPLHNMNDEAYKNLVEGYESFFRSQGTNVRRVANEQKHDRLMAETLALYHFNGLVMGMTVAGNNRSLEKHEGIIGTTATVADASIRSVVHSSPEMYFKIQSMNPFFPDVVKRYMDNAQKVLDTLVNGDQDTFANHMKQANDFYRGNQDAAFYLQGVKREFSGLVAYLKQ